ncbi:U3 small nucleolar ribonucleoprotein protein MPP10 [Culicoides brevitarsis]|uniref:U3 small nucleolar ribonucleoprotein protein MPP10 n=1 Tax=Culicoides brevitarsis TaxID=469753 RepID=UPI00307B5734
MDPKMLHKTTKKLKKLTSSPEQFLIIQNEKAEKLKETVKQLYDFGRTVQVESENKSSALNELIIDQMDEEQIWQQMEINNEEFLSNCLSLTSNLLSINQLKLDLPYEKVEEEEEPTNGHAESENEDFEQEEVEEKVKKSKKKTKKAGKKKSSIVDDKFFNLSEMEAFLEQEDKKEMRKGKKVPDEDDESEIDYFEDPGETDDSEAEKEENLKYSEYFDQSEDDDEDSEENEEDEEENDENSSRKVKFDLSKNQETTFERDEYSEDDQEEEENENYEENDEEDDTEKSSYEKHQAALRKKIEKLEEKAIQEKTWQLKGEISAQTRPENALLEEFLEFDSATRPAPIITEQTTMELEEIIKQRVKDRAFDDVVRKVKPAQSVQEYRKTLVLDSEKSKESLAQIYEKEFLKQQEKLDPDADDKPDDEPKEHQEIRKSLKSLFAKLDALSNYHITPRAAAPEVKIITNTPAISMEEVAPVTMSTAALLAPEEVKQKTKGETILAKEEMSKTDKNRMRREKKAKAKLKRKMQEEKQAELEKAGKTNKKLEQKKAMKEVMKNRNVEKMKETKGVNITSSSTFFSKLQEENTALGNKKKNQKKKKFMETSNGLTAKALKL